MFKHFNILVDMDSFFSFLKQTIKMNSCSTLLANQTTKVKFFLSHSLSFKCFTVISLRTRKN